MFNLGVTVFHFFLGYCSVFNLRLALCFRFAWAIVQCLILV